MPEESIDDLLERSPAFAAASRRFKLRIIWSLIAGVSTIAGLGICGKSPMWWALITLNIVARRLLPPRARRFLEVDLHAQ